MDTEIIRTENKVEVESKNINEPVLKKVKLSDNIETESKSDSNEIESKSSVQEKSKVKEIKNDSSENEDEEDLEIPEKGFTYPLEMDSSDMLEELDLEGDYYPSVTERYFTPYYELNVQKPGDDICIRVHSNRICMISLAPSHVIFQENKTIESCNYKVSEKLDRTQNKVSGKSKHGAQPLQSNSNLCCLTCTDGSKYMVKCCMIGKLIEVNERLIDTPELLKKEPHYGGYIAIVLPNLKHLDKMIEKMLNQEQYEEEIKKRHEKNAKQNEESKMELLETVAKESEQTANVNIDNEESTSTITKNEKTLIFTCERENINSINNKPNITRNEVENMEIGEINQCLNPDIQSNAEDKNLSEDKLELIES